MAGRMPVVVALAVSLVAALFAGASAQSSCMTAIVGLSPCLNYITGNSSTPSSSCCTQLASVVRSQSQCLCTVLNGGAAQFGIAVNQTMALALPGACKVQTPPVSQCNAASGGPPTSPTPAPKEVPAPAPSATPSESTNPTPETPSTPSTPATTSTSVPSGSGSKTTDVESSGGTATAAISPFFIFLLVASYTMKLGVY
uniref:Non-specific lipid-transfer protein-like protein At5g64080 n=1 Tax=Anthurium amnicola TaxID=1678845 RepID=A0A1D1YBR5_9ARAE